MASDDQAKRKESELNQLLDEIRRRAEEAELKRIEEIERKVSGLRTSSALPPSQGTPAPAAPAGNEQKILELREKLTGGTERPIPEKPSTPYKEFVPVNPRDKEREALKSRLTPPPPDQQRQNAKLFPIHPVVGRTPPEDSPVVPEKEQVAAPVEDTPVNKEEIAPPGNAGGGVKVVDFPLEPEQEEELSAVEPVREEPVESPAAVPAAGKAARPRVSPPPKQEAPAEEPKRSKAALFLILGVLLLGIGGYFAKVLFLEPKAATAPIVKADIPVETAVKPTDNGGTNDTKDAKDATASGQANTDAARPVGGTTTPTEQAQAPKPVLKPPVVVPEQNTRPAPSRSIKEDVPVSQPPVSQPKVDKPKEQPLAAVTEKSPAPVIEQPPPDFVPVSKEPVVVKRTEPKYPELAQKLGLEGRVIVRIWVDKDGKPKQVVILKSDNEVFNQAALEAARQFVFTPGYVSTGPVATWVAVPFKFKLSVAPR